MNPIRLILGVLLLSLCVFGVPEGCLVLASSAATAHLAVSDSEPGIQLPAQGDAEPRQLQGSFPHPIKNCSAPSSESLTFFGRNAE